MAQLQRRWSSSPLALALAVAVFAACSDRTGPGTSRVGQLGIAPRYQSASAAIVDVAAIRIRLVSTFDQRLALDTVVAIPAGADSVALGFAVPLEQPGEEFALFLRLIGPAGDTVFTSGPDVVRPATGGTAPTIVEPVLTYVGVGANAAAVLITSPDTTLFFGGAVVLQAVALDAGQAPIPGTPVEWISLDPLVVVVPDADSGRVIAGTQRGTARIVARLLTGQTDTVRVTAQPVPATLAPESGSGQTAPGGGLLPQPLVARVTAADALGVRGVWVRFAVTAGGGAIGADSVLTDSTGRASVSFQIGQTGPQTVQATAAALGGQVATFAATVQAGPPAGIAIVAGNAQTAIAGSGVPVAPRVVVTDSAGRLVSGAPVIFSVTQGGGNVAGATPVTGANGEAAVTGWTLGPVAGPNALRAIVVAPPTDTFSVTFAATSIAGPASLLQLVSGDAQSDTAGATLAQPLVVRATDANGNGAPGVPIAWTATAGTLSDDTVATDAAGLAQVAWTLPTTVGGPAATARIAGTAVTRGFTATVGPAAAQRTAFLAQPTDVTVGAAITPPVEVEITDRFGNRRTGDTGTPVSVALGANPSGATLGGTRTQPAAGGVVTFADLTVSAAGSGYTLVATATGLAPDTSTAFDALAPSGQVFWTNATGGNWSAGANWSTGTPPGPTDTAFVTLNGTYTVTLDVNPTLAGMVLGGASGTQTVAGTGRTLTLSGSATVGANGVLSLGGGSITGTGPLTNQGQVTLLDVPVGVAVVNEGILRLRGTTALNGAVSNLVGAELRVEASSVNAGVTTAAGWTNAGTLLLSHGGGGGGQSATLTVNGTLVNATGAVLRAEAGIGGGPRMLGAVLDNRALVDVQTPLTLARGSAAHLNSGTVAVLGGDLTVTQTGTTPSLTSTGTITVGTGRTLAITSGAWNTGGSTLNGGGAVTLNGVAWGLGAGYTVDSLVVSATGGSITGTGPLTTQGQVTLLDVPVGVAVVNEGILRLRGTTALNGAVSNLAGAELRVEASSVNAGVTTAAGWTNAGTLLLTHGGGGGGQAATLTVNGTLVNATGAVLRAEAGIGGGPRMLGAVLDNRALVDVQTPLTLARGSAAHLNSGTIAVLGGDLTVTQTGTTPSLTSTGTITVGVGRTLAITSGAWNTGGSTLNGAGAVTLNGVAWGLGAGYTVDSLVVSATGGGITGTGPLTTQGQVTLLDVPVGVAVVNEGILRLRGTTALNGAVSNLVGAELRVEASSVNAGVTTAAGWTNAGTLLLSHGGGGGGQSATLTVNGTLVNATGAVLRAEAGIGGGPRTLGAVLDNRALVDVQTPLTLARGSAAHLNSGTIAVLGGDLTVTQTGTTPSLTSTGTITVGTGRALAVSGGAFTNSGPGVVQGAGTLDVATTTFSNAGTVGPGLSPGLLTVTGNYPQTASGTLVLELGGTTAGTQYDRLAATGAATLAGTLDVALTGGFTPVGGEQFTVLTFASRAGDFTTVNLPALPGGLAWQRTFTGTAMVLGITSAFSGAPPGTDVVWIGAGSTSWTDAANWTPALPGPTDDVFIRADAANPLTVTGVRTIDTLAVQAGALVTVSGAADTLVVGGSLAAGSPAIAGSGAVRLTGANQTARGRVPNLVVTGAIAASDSLRVAGNLLITGTGRLSASAHRITVEGTLTTAASGTLGMTGLDDRVDVGGSATFGGGDSFLTGGVLTVAGNFTQSGTGPRFRTTDAHRTRLTGGAGQTVAFADALTNGFGQLTILTADSLHVASLLPAEDIVVADSLAPGGVVVRGTGYLVAKNPNAGNLVLRSDLGRPVRVRSAGVRLFGNVVLVGADVGVQVSELEYWGDAPVTIPADARVSFTRLTVRGTRTGSFAAGQTYAFQDLVVTDDASLGVGGATVNLSGDVATSVGGVLRMAAGDALSATNANFGGGSTAGLLTGGTLRVRGDFDQSGNAESFAPSGAHVTVLDGSFGTLTFADPAQASGSHFHHLDVSMSGTASNGGELVITGNLSIQDTAQFAPSGIVGGSGNRITVVGSATISQSQTAAVLTSDVLRFGGAVSRTGGAVVDGDTVEFFGTGQTVPTNLSPAFALKVTGDSVLFTGATTWRGMLVTGNGLADVGGSTLSVDSTFRTTGNGRLRMTNPAGKLSVRGEARFEGGSTAGRMTAGTLDLGGHFSQAGLTSPSSFAPSGTHLTQFRNFDYVPGNPSVVPVTISMSNTFASFFRNLLVDQEISASMPFRTVVTGSLTKPEFATLTGTTVEVGGDLTAGGALNGIIDFDTAMVAGVLTPNLSSQDYRIGVLVMTGAAQTLPSFPHYGTVAVWGDSVRIAGNADMLVLVVDHNGMADIGGAVQVYGSLETRGQGRLRMAGGSLFVGGGATFGGGSTAGLLTGGTLTIGGGLAQTAGNSPASFAASLGHTTEFANFDFRAIDFATPDSLASHFGTLSVGGAGELRLESDVHVVGQLRTPAPAGGVVRTLSGLNLQGRRLVTRGVDVDSLDLKALRLVIADGVPIGRFRDVRFVEQDPGVDRLEVRRAGGTYTFERLTFTTQPDPGFAYVSVIDADGSAATPFHLLIDQASPADPGLFVRTDGVATLTWGAGGGLLGGTVRNAVGGVEILGATVDLKAGANAPQTDPTLQSSLTDEAGAYSFSGLAAGDYTLWVSASGFIDGAVTGITVTTSGPATVDIALSPLQQAGETRIVLSWGAAPPDVDAYLVVPDTVGGPPAYVFYGSTGSAVTYPFASLDNDVTNGYGPETITIHQQLAGTYQFRVHDYAGGDNPSGTALLASEARVDVYQNNELVQTFFVPAQPGTLWTVFELDGATLMPINAMSGNPPTGGIGGAASQLAFTVQPSNTVVDQTIVPPVQVAALDNFGDPATGFTGLVTLTVGNDPSGTAVLNGTTTVAAVGGVANFPDLSISGGAGAGFVLTATVQAGGVADAFSQPFSVTPGAQLSGGVRYAIGAAPFAGASVVLKQGGNASTGDPTYQSTLTDANGGYYFPVPEGQYTLFFGASGHITTRAAGVVVTAGRITTVSAGLTPPVPAGQTRIVLSWTDTVPELDSHLLGPDGVGGEFHVDYVTPGDSVNSPFALLHQDLGDGQGPEAVTIYTQQAGVYEFRVHDWERGAEPADSVLRVSGARVDVFQGTQQVQSLAVPFQLGTLWKVFQLSGATITPLNTITGDPPGIPIGGGAAALRFDGASREEGSVASRLGPPRAPLR